MKWLLSTQDPIALSNYSIKAITTQGAKEPNRETLLELLEFMTDIPKDMSLGDLRVLADLNDFIAKRSILNGRRCNSLRLPVDWSTCGFYQAKLEHPDDDKITTAERFTNISIEAECSRERGTFPAIEMNYSKKRASLAYTSESGCIEYPSSSSSWLRAICLSSPRRRPPTALAI